MRSRLINAGGVALGFGLVTGMILGPANATSAHLPTEIFMPRLIDADSRTAVPSVVKIHKRIGGSISGCSAYVWRPQILITAAHCVSRDLSHELADEVRYLPPGTNVTGQPIAQQWEAGLPVQEIFRPDEFFNAPMGVSRDVAVMVVPDPQPLAVARRLVTPMELAQIAISNNNQGRSALIAGYGPTVLNGPMSDRPNSTRGQLDGFYPVPDTNEGKFFANLGFATGGPGDSGSPVVLPGDGGGFAFPIAAGENASTQGFSPLGWPGMVNKALAMIGAAQIPSPPGAPRTSERKNGLTLTWNRPTTGSDWVVRYEVLNQDLKVMCSTTANKCSSSWKPKAGDIAFVRAVNTEGEGSASDITVLSLPRKMLPPYPAPNFSAQEPFVRIRLLGPKEATGVSRYEMQDDRGTRICRVTQPEADFGRAGDGDTGYDHCYVKFSSKDRKFRVRAKNEYGWGKWSSWSAPIRP